MLESEVANGTDKKPPKRPMRMKRDDSVNLITPVDPTAVLPGIASEVEVEAEVDPYATASPEENAALARAKNGGAETVASFVQRRDGQHIKDWLSRLGDRPNIRVSISRKRPDHIIGPNGQRINTLGFCQSFTEIIEVEDIERMFGGGEYEYRVMGPDKTGKGMKFITSTMVTVQGDPKPAKTFEPPSSSADPIVTKALTMMDESRQRTESELARLREGGGGGAQIAKLYEIQLAAEREDKRRLTDRLDALDKELREAQNRPERADPMRDKIFDQMVGGADARLTAVRQQHESEIRVLKESHQQEIRMIQERNDRDKEHLIRSHERTIDDLRASASREISNLKESSAREISNLTAVHQATSISTKSTAELTSLLLTREIDTARATLAELRADNKALQAKANPSIADKVAEINALKEIVSPSDGEEETPWYLKLAETPFGQGMLTRVMGAIDPPAAATATPAAQQQAAQAAQQQAAQQRQPRRIRDRRNGQVMLQHPNGAITPLLQPTADGKAEAVWAIPPEDVVRVVQFLEMACANKVPPETFVIGARNHITPEIMEAIRREGGVDEAIHKMAELEPASILLTQDGRNWIRKVGKLILGKT